MGGRACLLENRRTMGQRYVVSFEGNINCFGDIFLAIINMFVWWLSFAHDFGVSTSRMLFHVELLLLQFPYHRVVLFFLVLSHLPHNSFCSTSSVENFRFSCLSSTVTSPILISNLELHVCYCVQDRPCVFNSKILVPSVIAMET